MLLPETTVWPGKTTAVSDMSVETVCVRPGCLPAEAFDKDEVEPARGPVLPDPAAHHRAPGRWR